MLGKWAICLTALLLSAGMSLAAGPPLSLADAVEEMDRDAIQALLDRRSDVNATQPDGMTALHWAAYRDNLETAKLLLKAGADVKVRNRYGVTPLSLACTNGNAEMVKLLLDAGADANAALPGGETALMTASRTGEIETVRALIARGADPNAKDERRGQSAIMWAAAEGHAAVVEELIEAGADFKSPVASGFTPLLFAVREGRIEAAKVLLKAGVDVNQTIEHQRRGRRGGYGRLQGGTSALLLAASNAHYEMAAMLLDAGADPNAAGPGYTTLHVIPSVRNPGIGDNDPPPPGSGNMTSIELVRKLVKKGADVNARMTQQVNLGNTRLNKLGATPYFLAAQSADTELMRALAEMGADPLLKNVENSTPLMAIAGIGTRSPGEDAGTEEEMVEAMQLALELGDDINAVDDNGETAMHGAAYKNAPLAVEFLDAKGANPAIWNRKNVHGWTPLSIADGYRFGNFKPSPVTVEAILKVMAKHGLSRPVDGEPVRGKEIY